jgi:hypothetical protein
MPNYTGYRRTKEGGREAYHWTVNEIWESECPVSAITQKSFELVQLVNTLQGAKKAAGSTLGADEMPGFLLDAVRLVQSESGASELARDEAVNR